MARRPTQFSTTTLRSAELEDTLYAGTAYLMMADSKESHPIVAEHVVIDMNAAGIGIPDFMAVLTESVAGDSTLVLNLDPAEDQQYFELVEPSTVLKAFTGAVKSRKRLRATINSSSDQAYKTLAKAIETARLTYQEWHHAIEPAWNTQLLDSIASARVIYVAMDLTNTNTIKGHATGLLALVELYKLQLIDKSNPIDYTGYIVNPSFESGKKDGWKSESNATIRPKSNLATFASGMHGEYLLYNETSTGSTTISQTIEGLPQGYYRLTAMVGTSPDNTVTLFANDSTTIVSAHEWGRFYLTEGVVDSVRVDDGTLTIGVEAGTSWYKADNFALYYLGAGVDTSIELPDADTPATAVIRQGIYDLFGRRLADSSMMLPGRIYIIDGRKVIAR